MTTTNHLEHIAPSLLVLDKNVRKDLGITKEFQQSIELHGVLEPVVAYPDPINDGHYKIHIGHRRTAAAQAANLESIPVYVISEREAVDRITEQVSENIHRAALTPTEEAAAYKELALFGLPASQIAKRTSTKLARVGDGLKLAETTWKHQPDAQLTFDQLAALAEFSDDATKLKALEEVALVSPTRLPHAIADARKERETRERKKELNAQIDAGGWEKVKLDAYGYVKDANTDTLALLSNLALESSPHEKLTIERAQEISDIHICAAVAEDWEHIDGNYTRVPVIRYYVRDWKESGLVMWRAESFGTAQAEAAEIVAARAEREAEWEKARIARAEHEEKRVTASEVREEWIKQLLQRPKLPDDWTQLVGHALINGVWIADEYEDIQDEQIFILLGEPVPVTDDDADVADEPFKAALSALLENPRRVNNTILAMIIARIESDAGSNKRLEYLYLSALDQWGYGLSEYETDRIAAYTEKVTAA